MVRTWLACLALLFGARDAGATYSVVATDSATAEVGGAGTSCVGSLSVTIIHGAAPGIGTVHAQAQVNTAGRDRAVVLLQANTAPADIIAEITGAAFDGNAAVRQYGVVDLQGRAAGFTGSQTIDVAADVQGSDGRYTYSIQGNILTADVLAQAEAGFLAGGCDLAERMMVALEAGAQNGQGDSRCTGGGIPSDSAFISLHTADGTRRLLLDVVDTAPDDPIPMLRAQFDAWRADNPCPAVDDAGPTPADAGGDAGPGADDPGGSCGCRGGDPDLGGVLLLLAVAAALTRRRSPPM